MRRIYAIARKEFIHIIRDPRTMIAVLIMPLLQLFLFSYAVSFDVKDLPTALLDQDHTATSRQYVDALKQSNYFVVNKNLTSVSEIDGVFDRNDSRVVVVISPGFGDSVAAGRAGAVQILVDGSEPNSAQLGQAYANGLSQIWGTKTAISRAEASGANPAMAGGLSARTRIWYNPEAKSASYLVPGLIVLLLTVMTVQQTANTLVSEKEQGTYEQLVVSPIRRIELMIGKVMPWAVMAALNVITISAIGLLVFQIPFRGSVLLFALSSFLFVLCVLGLGLVISARSSSTEVANQLAMMISFLPAFMLSGFVFPLANIPPVLQGISYLFPARYMTVISRTVFLKGGGWDVLWPQIAALAVYAVVIITLSSLLYRERS
jgi:ABC-2 type transport system permease protein